MGVSVKRDRMTNVRCPFSYESCVWNPWEPVSICLDCWIRRPVIRRDGTTHYGNRGTDD